MPCEEILHSAKKQVSTLLLFQAPLFGEVGKKKSDLALEIQTVSAKISKVKIKILKRTCQINIKK